MNTLFDLPPQQKAQPAKTLPVWKLVYMELLKGSTIERYGKRYKVRNAARIPLRIVGLETVRVLKDCLKRDKRNETFVLDRKYIRSLSKRYWIKKMYLLFLKKRTNGVQ